MLRTSLDFRVPISFGGIDGAIVVETAWYDI
jgi:hypothetical protein